MSISTSILDQLLRKLPNLRPQIYFKSSLTALSHAMEDQVLAGNVPCLVIASFQQERFYRQEAQRYRRIARLTSQVYVLSAPEADFTSGSGDYERVAFGPTDYLRHEWHLVVIGSRYSACLICNEKQDLDERVERLPVAMDQNRRFEGIWTFDNQVSAQAANILLDRILSYRPELADKIACARAEFLSDNRPSESHADPFAQRLITYLQAGQYKLSKVYRAIVAQSRREHLVNLITAAIRQSLNPDQIFSVAVQELGQTMQVDRCFIYPCRANDHHRMIQHEFLQATHLTSCVGLVWPLATNPLFQAIAHHQETIAIENVNDFTGIDLRPLESLIDTYNISGWMLVPIIHQTKLMGVIELMTVTPMAWSSDDLKMVDAIAAQLGIALIQADAYANLEALNQQLEDLERTRSNLIAITGHELRTPLSTIQVCLESLATEPDMPQELQQVMLSTALNDAERLRKLVQDFLTLSQLESGRVEWHLESLSMEECIELALSSIRTHQHSEQLPSIQVNLPANLPFVRADGEWLVEVLSKLLDNACKFTEPSGSVEIVASLTQDKAYVKVLVADTGRGIEPNQLEAVFDRFHQEEGALRRTTGGTGLGLAICHQIIKNLDGQIWATSEGKGKGSQFHLTIPAVLNSAARTP
ncbi:MAG: DICT sensory domain-containing protein [Leptolyngbyaceae bacterium]|nr:DICT sensory domain-containing protein [Leptolyngbyaceae bacterium]